MCSLPDTGDRRVHADASKMAFPLAACKRMCEGLAER